MQQYQVESVELNEDLWRAWVLKGKLRDQKAAVRGRWIVGVCAVVAVVAGVGLIIFRA